MTNILTFLGQEINTAHGFFNLQALLHLTCVDIPEPDRFVVGAANETLATQEEGRAEVGMPIEETNVLGKGISEVGFTVMERFVEWFPVLRKLK